MAKLKVIKAGPVTTVQDFGRFGYRRYGIPQSGAMDKEFMTCANKLIGNLNHYPVIEFAMMGMKLQVIEPSEVAVVGAVFKINGDEIFEPTSHLSPDDILEIASPNFVYAYMAIRGLLVAQSDFESFSTYARAGFGGVKGRAIQKGDELVTVEKQTQKTIAKMPERLPTTSVKIRMMKGPEWSMLKELPESKSFHIDVSTDRMGVRLSGNRLKCDYSEIASSAVVPGTIQLPPDGQPIILMNDCQTTGGYPRIAKVLDEDLGRLAQLKPNSSIQLHLD